MSAPICIKICKFTSKRKLTSHVHSCNDKTTPVWDGGSQILVSSPVSSKSRILGQEMTVLCDRLRVARGVRSWKREPQAKAGDASGLGRFPLVAAKLKD